MFTKNYRHSSDAIFHFSFFFEDTPRTLRRWVVRCSLNLQNGNCIYRWTLGECKRCVSYSFLIYRATIMNYELLAAGEIDQSLRISLFFSCLLLLWERQIVRKKLYPSRSYKTIWSAEFGRITVAARKFLLFGLLRFTERERERESDYSRFTASARARSITRVRVYGKYRECRLVWRVWLKERRKNCVLVESDRIISRAGLRVYCCCNHWPKRECLSVISSTLLR